MINIAQNVVVLCLQIKFQQRNPYGYCSANHTHRFGKNNFKSSPIFSSMFWAHPVSVKVTHVVELRIRKRFIWSQEMIELLNVYRLIIFINREK